MRRLELLDAPLRPSRSGERAMTAAGLILAAIAASGCARGVEPDAYGNVEATEVVVGAEATGRLLTFTIAAGAKLSAGAAVGTIDAAQLNLEREHAGAQRAATASRVNEVRQQIAGLEAQRGAAVAQRDAAQAQREALVAQQEIAKRAYDRATRLFAEQAATALQLDQAEREYRVLLQQVNAQNDQIKAQERQIAAQGDLIQAARAQQQTASHQVASADAQVSQVGERINRTRITTPLAGTVLTTYARAGEFVQTGQPLFKLANLEVVEVRAYVTEPQLAGVRLGQDARVSLDAGRGQRQTLSGSVTWIASEAEFTPTPIQTREERADLVYAIKIRVPNDGGVLKIGMPVDVQFAGAQAAR